MTNVAIDPRRCAIVVGAAGQDGYYLTRFLTRLGYRVLSIGRDQLTKGTETSPFSVMDGVAVARLIALERPTEVYYLAAHHHSSQESPGSLRALINISYEVHSVGLLNILDAIVAGSPLTRLFYAASSLVFGLPNKTPQNEDTAIAPVCTYGLTKAMGIGICRIYRLERGIFCASGILYNHELPRRGETFVTRKIARAVAEVHRGRRSPLNLGSLDTPVDWSYAGDTVRAMHAILQLDAPNDFVIASGKLHTVREFAHRAFATAGFDYRDYVRETPSVLQRSLREHPLQGDPSLLRAATGWEPQVSFESLVDMMVQAEIGDGPAA